MLLCNLEKSPYPLVTVVRAKVEHIAPLLEGTALEVGEVGEVDGLPREFFDAIEFGFHVIRWADNSIQQFIDVSSVPVCGLEGGNHALGTPAPGTPADCATSEPTIEASVADLVGPVVHAAVAGNNGMIVVHRHDNPDRLASDSLVFGRRLDNGWGQMVVDVVEVDDIRLELG